MIPPYRQKGRADFGLLEETGKDTVRNIHCIRSSSE